MATTTTTTLSDSPRSSFHDNDLRNSFRGQAVFVRHENETSAMTGLQRFRANLRNVFRSNGPHDYHKKHDKQHDDEELQGQQNDGAPGHAKPTQYRLAATSKPKKRRRWKTLLKWLTCLCLCTSSRDADVRIQNRNSTLSKYLHFAFKISFVSLFALMCVLFFGLAAFFAALIVLAGVMDRDCVRAEGGTFGSAGSPFAEAFSLSWTTLSTVGYGSTYPALGYQNNNRSHCLFITMTCLMEAFVGVLYSGFCGAILFGKVVRIQSHAHVIFSDPVVIRYGSGVEDEVETEGHGDDDKENSKKHNSHSQTKEPTNGSPQEATCKKREKIPLPVLEFRIVNKLFGQPGGEIMDASLTVVANIDARDADSAVHGASSSAADSEFRWLSQSNGEEGAGSYDEIRTPQHSWDATNQESRESSFFGGATPHSVSSAGGLEQQPASWHGRTKLFDPLASIQAAAMRNLYFRHRDHQTVDEDPTARLVSKRIFSKMLIEASEHPFFKRVWLVRHVLDENSPILKASVRRRIWRNGGYWPEKLNHYHGVRSSLQFNQILVSLNGVSNVSAASVYAQKIYDYVDVTVGFRFCNIMYVDAEGELKVDTDLINDVVEQNGGGGEPLFLDE